MIFTPMWRFVYRCQAFFSIAFAAGLHGITAEIAQEIADGESVTIDGDFPLPTIGIYASVNPIKPLGFELAAQGMEASIGDGKVAYLDARLQAIWRPWNMLGVLAGYRYATYDIRFDDGNLGNAKANLDLSGFYLGALAQF